MSDVVYEDIRGLIVDGTWPARSRLPSETELASQFGVSRPVVRQALARLRSDGLISSRQGSGSFVRQIGNVPAEVQFPAISSVADLERFLGFREGVEGEAAAAAATFRSEARIEELRRAAAADFTSSLEDFQFHLTIARASENPFYLNALQSLRKQIMFSTNLAHSFASERNDEISELIAREHRAIAEAIIERDADAARALMRTHLGWARSRILTGSVASDQLDDQSAGPSTSRTASPS